jgi:hypothetical protein
MRETNKGKLVISLGPTTQSNSSYLIWPNRPLEWTGPLTALCSATANFLPATQGQRWADQMRLHLSGQQPRCWPHHLWYTALREAS